MKRAVSYLAVLLILAAFGLTILAHAGDLPPIPLTTASSTPTRIAGDVNGDKVVDLQDAALLTRYLAGGWNVTVDLSAANVNNDNVVDLKDVVLIRRYLAHWNVTLQ